MLRFLPLLAVALIATTAHAQDLKSTLDALGLEVATEGGVIEVVPTMLEFSPDEFGVEASAELDGGTEYVLFIAGDDNDVDVIIFDSEYESIADGMDYGNTETVVFTPATSGTYRFSFSSDCPDTCAFGYSLFSR